MLVDVADERHVELDVVAVERRERAHPRVAAAEVVDRDLEAELAQLGDAIANVGLTLERRPLGDLEDHAARDARQWRERRRQLLVEQIEQVEVHEHDAALGWRFGDDLRGLRAHRAAEHRDLLEPLGRVEDRARMRQRAIGRAQQGLVTKPRAIGRVDDRLEMHRERREATRQLELELGEHRRDVDQRRSRRPTSEVRRFDRTGVVVGGNRRRRGLGYIEPVDHDFLIVPSA